ncbi:MAG: putative cation antiporter NADH dehydrogenase subunit [Acidimicrobiales bacterium]|nr:MAG: putative cation antiporter NADH dehydrogenase subunit [Acidimicrobiales bacterium]
MSTSEAMPLTLIVAVHFIAAVVVLAAHRHLRRAVWVVASLPLLASLAWGAAHMSELAGGRVFSHEIDWIPQIGLRFAFRADAFSAVMVMLVSGVGLLVFWYASHYFRGEPLGARVAGLLTMFAGSMTGLVLSDDLLGLFVFWELTSVTSYLLIGTKDRDESARQAAQHALMVTTFGGLAMLAGFVLLGEAGGTPRLSELVESPPTGGGTVAVAMFLVAAGAFTKSAQFPFHGWLPEAMAAPTPISAYLHSAAMVKAGVYLLARLAPIFAEQEGWTPTIVVVGTVTMMLGGLRALRAVDLKQLLAFGTISQLGLMTTLFGLGNGDATGAGVALLLAHAVFKAPLFMLVGAVDHETGTRDVRLMPRLGSGWGGVRWAVVAAAASMAGFPATAGFVAKEAVFEVLSHGSAAEVLVLAGVVAASMLTVAYSIRLVTAFTAPERLGSSDSPRGSAAKAPPCGMVAPAALLAFAGVFLGVAPVLWSGLVSAASEVLGEGSDVYLAVWHGFGIPLTLSLAALAGGSLVFRHRQTVDRVQQRLAIPLSAAYAYRVIVDRLMRSARLVTSVVQCGSLPIYAAIILTFVSVSALLSLFGRWVDWGGVEWGRGDLAQLPGAVLMVGGAAAAAWTTRRFAAALLMGVAGYGIASVFVVRGAPDLALTQFLVETLSVVVFLLVMRALPERFDVAVGRAGRVWRACVACLVGIFVFSVGLAAHSEAPPRPVSEEMPRLAYEEGDGRNVVNVILVDIRGLDTLGEITVLATSAVGIVALARAGMRPRSIRRKAVVRGESGGEEMSVAADSAGRPTPGGAVA